MNHRTRRCLLLITYAVVLYLVLSNLGAVGRAVGKILSVFRPVLTGVLIAYVLNQLLRPMEGRWLRKVWDRHPGLAAHRRGISVFLSLIVVLAFLVTLGIFILPEVGESVAQLAGAVPGYISAAVGKAETWKHYLDMGNPIIAHLCDAAERLLNDSGDLIMKLADGMAPWLLKTATSLTSGIVNLAMGLVFAVYMLANKEHLARIGHRLLEAFLTDRARERILRILRKADRAFGGFIAGQLIEAVILGALCFTGLTIIGFFVDGMPYTLLISVLVGFCNIIPIIGAYISAIPAALLILLISPMKALIFIVFLVICQQFEGNVIYPRVVGHSIGIAGMWVLFALVVGGKMFGLPGMVIGIPMFAVIYSLVREFTEDRIRRKRGAGGLPAAEPQKTGAPRETPPDGD